MIPVWSIDSEPPIPVDILLFDDFSNYCLANLLEPFRAANDLSRRQIYDWQILTPHGAAAISSSGLRIQADASLESQRPMGLLFVVCSYGYRKLDTKLNRRVLRSAAGKAKTVIGMDTGAWLLAGAGLLDGRRATIHWHVFDAFLEAFVSVAGAQQSFVADGKFITSGGAAAAYDLAQYIIEETAGCSISLDVGAIFVRETARKSCYPRHCSHSRLTSNALALMQSTIEEPLTVRDIADRIASTQRQLERDFRKAFGAAPSQVYRRLRLSAVRRLLEDTRLPIAEIAVRTGYQNASAMSRAFRAQYGHSPRAFRREIERPDNRVQIRSIAVGVTRVTILDYRRGKQIPQVTQYSLECRNRRKRTCFHWH